MKNKSIYSIISILLLTLLFSLLPSSRATVHAPGTTAFPATQTLADNSTRYTRERN